MISKIEFFRHFNDTAENLDNILRSKDAIELAFSKFQEMLTEHMKTRDGLERYRTSKIIGFVLKMGNTPEECHFFKLIFLADSFDNLEMSSQEQMLQPLNEVVATDLNRMGWKVMPYEDSQIFIFAEVDNDSEDEEVYEE